MSAGKIRRILSGPHIKRMIVTKGSAPIVEIEAMAFHRLTRWPASGPWRISKRSVK